MSSNWFYSSNGQQHGPISAAQLKQLADGGTIGPDDLVCQEGSDQWVAAKRLKGLFTTPQSAPPVSDLPVETLPQIQINVSNAIKGIGSAVQGAAQSQPVKDAAAAVQNAAGQAAEGLGNFVRSDAVQSQVTAANSLWSSLTTQNKLLAVGIGSLGLLMVSCCVCGVLGMMFGGSGDTEKPTVSKPNKSGPTTPTTPDVPVTKRSDSDPLKFAYQQGYANGCRAGDRVVQKIDEQRGQVAKDHLIKAMNENALAGYESQRKAHLDALRRGAQDSASIQRAIGEADGFRDTLAKAGYVR